MDVTESVKEEPEKILDPTKEDVWMWLAAIPCPKKREETLERCKHILKKEAPFKQYADEWRLKQICEFLASTAFELKTSLPHHATQRERAFWALGLREKVLLVWVDALHLPLETVAGAFQLSPASTELLLGMTRTRIHGPMTREWLRTQLLVDVPSQPRSFTPRHPKWLAIPLHLSTTFFAALGLLLLVSSNTFQETSREWMGASSTVQAPEVMPEQPSPEAAGEMDQETKTSVPHLKKIKGSGSRWRFTLKTIHPAALKTRMEDILRQELKETIRGATVPGGIQFDLLIPTSQFGKVRERIMGLEEKPGHFTWIRQKPRQPPPKGMEILQIWLTQP